MSQLIDYLANQLVQRRWSQRTLAARAEVSPNTVSYTLAGKTIPDPDTVRKLATALAVDESHLLRLAGHLEEIPQKIKDPAVFEIARRLDGLDPELRTQALKVVSSLANAFYAIQDQPRWLEDPPQSFGLEASDSEEIA